VSLSAAVALERGRLLLDVQVDVGDGEVVALLGPNGAGKSSFLAAVAGLLPLERGRVVLDGTVFDDTSAGVHVPPERRPIGMVFQDGRLFPHLSVVDNVAFGLRARAGMSRRDAQGVARESLAAVGLEEMAGSKPGELSGGQAQRVALARALVMRPRLLLLDEPLTAVDLHARAGLRRQIGEALRQAEATRLLVTHDAVDAVALADRLVVIEEGRVVQQGTADDLRSRPRSRYAAELVGVNLLRGRASGGVVELEGGHVVVAADTPAGDVFVLIHPKAVALHRHPPEGTPRNVWRSTAEAVDMEGDRARVRVGGLVPLVAEVTPAAVAELRLAEGGEVWATVKATEVEVYEA
jgi:molybdate transport system ATP-binding protein